MSGQCPGRSAWYQVQERAWHLVSRNTAMPPLHLSLPGRSAQARYSPLYSARSTTHSGYDRQAQARLPCLVVHPLLLPSILPDSSARVQISSFCMHLAKEVLLAGGDELCQGNSRRGIPSSPTRHGRVSWPPSQKSLKDGQPRWLSGLVAMPCHAMPPCYAPLALM
ncbi:hypothetical protein LY76DRAFT_308787 [Colletotrichum caudatum]|nr:hypothetical protein LY76DRAFT_308787 [Colletotrichum caudatum]